MHNCNNTCCCNNQDQQYEEFVHNKEYAVGEFFKIENKVFKVAEVQDTNCSNCDIPYYRKCETRCASWERKDDTNVEFILYDTLEENE